MEPRVETRKGVDRESGREAKTETGERIEKGTTKQMAILSRAILLFLLGSFWC
jgi:hypothetical protein